MKKLRDVLSLSHVYVAQLCVKVSSQVVGSLRHAVRLRDYVTLITLSIGSCPSRVLAPRRQLPPGLSGVLRLLQLRPMHLCCTHSKVHFLP